MDPVSDDIVIGRPREEVFDYLVDIANHAEFCDHFLKDWHLTRLESSGHGAGARFRVDAPFNRFGWADMTFIEVDRPYRIVAAGRGGKYNRIKTWTTWTLTPQGDDTRVEYSTETEPPLPTDRLVEALTGRRGWYRRRVRRMLSRLQAILEDGTDRGRRATVGGLSALGG